MSNQLDIRPEAMNLSDPDGLFHFLDGYLDYTLDFAVEAKDPEDFSNKVSDHALFLTAAFTTKMPMVLVDEHDFGENLGKRLRNSLFRDGLVLENSDILMSAKTSDFIFYASVLMAQQFMDLIQDCASNETSSEVFELRRDAFVKDWVNRFLGKDKYAD